VEEENTMPETAVPGRRVNAALIGSMLLLACSAILWLRLSPVRAQQANNTRDKPSVYVPASECAKCHAGIAASFAQTGMAHSLYPAIKDPIANALRSEVVYYHAKSHSWFSMERREGKIYQKRWQRDANGDTVNLDSEEVHYVVGSGDHVRTYLHRNANGTITELPLAWYAENGGTWALNPGFDNAAPPTRRGISYACIFCHDSYPAVPHDLGDSVAHPVFVGNLPEGIDCQRCHGPGSAHVQAAQTPGALLQHVRSTILNPASLSNERQMEVCMQCHLEVTSFRLPDRIQRYDQKPFGYTPDKPLESYFKYFQRDLKGIPDPQIGIDGAAYRLRQSLCFLRSNGALTCERCHDPHLPHNSDQAERRYLSVCLSCHSSALSSLVSERKHTSETDCASCHMPKRRTDDVVHAVITDHLIQRIVSQPALRLALKDEATEPFLNGYRGELEPYQLGTFASTDDDLYSATAQVLQDSNSINGIDRLTKLIGQKPTSQPEFSIELGDALHRAGQSQKAIDAYRDAVRADPHSLRARRSLGAALAETGDIDTALKELRATLRDYPDESLLWYEIGRIDVGQKQLPRAIEELTNATKLDPESAEAYNELGIALAESGDFKSAKKAFIESLRISPYEAGVSRNLEMLQKQPSGR
jgi:tetratricopeptide (TPR) repeat protein